MGQMIFKFLNHNMFKFGGGGSVAKSCPALATP